MFIMLYQFFLQTISQLSSKGKASIALDTGTICIQSMPGKDKWRISKMLLEEEKGLPLPIYACIPSTGTLRIENIGPYLELNASATNISLIDEIEIHKDRYLSFKKQMEDFVKISKEWQEIFSAWI